MTPRPRGAQCGFSPCGVLVLAVYIGFTDVGILFWLLRGDTCGAFSHMRVCTLSLIHILGGRTDQVLCDVPQSWCSVLAISISEFFIACSFFDSFGSFCPIYSKKVWQITKKCCKMTFLLKENLPI